MYLCHANFFWPLLLLLFLFSQSTGLWIYQSLAVNRPQGVAVGKNGTVLCSMLSHEYCRGNRKRGNRSSKGRILAKDMQNIWMKLHQRCQIWHRKPQLGSEARCGVTASDSEHYKNCLGTPKTLQRGL